MRRSDDGKRFSIERPKLEAVERSDAERSDAEHDAERSDDDAELVYVAPPAADLVQLHERHLKRSGASLRKGAAVAMHLQLGISPGWFGDQLFDPGSDRVRKVTKLATQFVEKRLGGGVFAARFDVDEESGGGVVDVFASPVHENARSGRKVVSCRKSVQALGKASGHAGKPLRGLQDLWHRECASKLDEAIERGAPVEETQAVHLGVDEYKLLKGLEERALYAIRAVRRRWRQRARTRQQEAAVDKDPLLALLEAVVKPDLTDEEYAELSSAIEDRLESEREALGRARPGQRRPSNHSIRR